MIGLLLILLRPILEREHGFVLAREHAHLVTSRVEDARCVTLASRMILENHANVPRVFGVGTGGREEPRVNVQLRAHDCVVPSLLTEDQSDLLHPDEQTGSRQSPEGSERESRGEDGDLKHCVVSCLNECCVANNCYSD